MQDILKAVKSNTSEGSLVKDGCYLIYPIETGNSEVYDMMGNYLGYYKTDSFDFKFVD